MFEAFTANLTGANKRTTKLSIDYYEKILAHLPDPIFVRDEDRNVVYCNKAALKLTGRNDGGDLKCDKFMCNNIPAGYCDSSCPIEKAFRTNLNEIVQNVKIKKANGDPMFGELTAIVLKGEKGEFQGGIEIIRNTTDMVREKQELKNQGELMQQLIRQPAGQRDHRGRQPQSHLCQRGLFGLHQKIGRGDDRQDSQGSPRHQVRLGPGHRHRHEEELAERRGQDPDRQGRIHARAHFGSAGQERQRRVHRRCRADPGHHRPQGEGKPDQGPAGLQPAAGGQAGGRHRVHRPGRPERAPDQGEGRRVRQDLRRV